MRFETSVELGGKNATGLRVPEEVVAALSTKKRLPVKITVGGHSYRTTVGPYGDGYFVPLSAENRKAAGVAAGDAVTVDIEVDDEPRVVEVPEDLAAALAAAGGRAAFDKLSYSHQRAHVLSVTDAKTDATRQRRVEKVVTALTTP
ncbi:YdeI/OmpD-associated family protein [Actinokineospora cianjurensis]|uniref:Bacteriocin resistance YdeI/OmpD-like protein n=1 Tax=Actinokineospora cianjurensis TaxID=585224 RepID=A0A421B4R2_9PSEU|nr:YdeI/OmpD-associated family protein [Actinokineospora cianjurensis]RLK59344.1 bacteriocin resistance YdeI/OmpD-like protein [Actinokineospora cianjurensis]